MELVHLPHTQLSLRADGYITDDAEYVFTRGHCHSFALALHRLTGWQLYGLYQPYELDRGDTPGHVVVRTPQGEFVDVTGAEALENWKNYYPDTIPAAVTEEEVLAFEENGYKPSAPEMAEVFARFLLNNRIPFPVQYQIPFQR